MKTNEISHRFFRIRASALNDDQQKVNGVGHVCLVLKPSLRSKNVFRAAFSFKSPADLANRELGLKIAEGRLTSTRPGRNFKIEAKNLEAAFAVAVEDLFNKSRKVCRKGKMTFRPFAPNWLYQAVVENERQLLPLKS